MKYEKTKHEGIFSYRTKKGLKYRVRIVYDYDKEHSKSGFETIAEAQAYKAMQESKLLMHGSGIFKGNKVTFGQQWEKYKKYKIENGDWNLNTSHNAEHRIKAFLDVFENYHLNDISAKKVQKIINDMYEQHDYSQETVQSYFNLFKQVLTDAVNDGILTTLNINKVTYKKRNWQPTNKKIDLSDLIEFMTLAKKYMRKDIYRCLYLLTFGLRRGEAYAIKQSHIKFMPNGLARLEIVIQRTRNYLDGKIVKSRSSNRIVIVDQVMAGYLREQIEFAKQVKAKKNQTLHKDDFIFIHPESGLPYSEKTLNNAIDKITAMMDNNVNITPHMFRHTFATYASGIGADQLQLKNVLGHASLSMTEHYTGPSEEAAINILNLTKNFRKFEKDDSERAE
ncbi:tyrosine-type recombinase/integrase [Ignavigranum ruoffiae]